LYGFCDYDDVTRFMIIDNATQYKVIKRNYLLNFSDKIVLGFLFTQASIIGDIYELKTHRFTR